MTDNEIITQVITEAIEDATNRGIKEEVARKCFELMLAAIKTEGKPLTIDTIRTEIQAHTALWQVIDEEAGKRGAKDNALIGDVIPEGDTFWRDAFDIYEAVKEKVGKEVQ